MPIGKERIPLVASQIKFDLTLRVSFSAFNSKNISDYPLLNVNRVIPWWRFSDSRNSLFKL